jgi:hypothetical protein
MQIQLQSATLAASVEDAIAKWSGEIIGKQCKDVKSHFTVILTHYKKDSKTAKCVELTPSHKSIYNSI